MRQLWLEKMAEQGLIRKEAVPHIYEEVNTFMKEASAQFGGLKPEDVAKKLSEALGMAITGAAFMGGKSLMEILKKRRENNQARESILKSRAAVIAQYKDPEDREKAQARFDEVAQYAPHVAMNAPLVSKIVRGNLHSGISDETAQRLALVQSSYITDLKQQQKMLPKMASLRPEVIGELTADLYMMSKTAAPFSGKDVSKYLKTVLTYSSIPLVAGAVSGLATMGLDKIKDKDMKSRLDHSFNTAIRQAPEIHREVFLQDREKTRQAFDALAHFAPHVALQPHAARTFMKKMIDYYDQGGMNVTDVKELTEIEKNIAGTQKARGFSRGFEGGAKFVTTGPVSKGIDYATSELMSPGDTLAEMASGGHI